jgi:hypothetical protein
MGIERVARSFAVLVAAVALSACANLKAVRDFAGSSAQLTGYTDVSERYLSSQERIAAEIPRDKDFDADRAQVAQLKPKVDAQRDSILKLHNVATGYMAALARLAGDESFNISKQIDEVTGAIVAAPELGLSAEHVSAFGNIAKTVTSWALAARQAKEVKSMVGQYGDSMDKLLEAMEFITDAMRIQLMNERGKIRIYLSVYEGAYTRDVGVEGQAPASLSGGALERYNAERVIVLQRRDVTLLQLKREHAVLLKREQDAVDSASQAVDGIRVVRAGHAEMRKNVNNLSSEDVMALLAKAADDLKSIRENLKKL